MTPWLHQIGHKLQTDMKSSELQPLFKTFKQMSNGMSFVPLLKFENADSIASCPFLSQLYVVISLLGRVGSRKESLELRSQAMIGSAATMWQRSFFTTTQTSRSEIDKAHFRIYRRALQDFLELHSLILEASSLTRVRGHNGLADGPASHLIHFALKLSAILVYISISSTYQGSSPLQAMNNPKRV